MSPSSGLWGGSWIMIPSLLSWVHHRSTSPSIDALQACVPLSISSHVHIVPNVLPRSLCGCPRISLHLLEEGHNHSIVRFAYLCHMISEEFVSAQVSPFLYIKLFELGVEVALNHRSAVTHHNVNLYIRSSELHWLRPHTVACPRNDLRRKTLDRGCTVSLDFFDRYCHLCILCLLRQLFIAADS